MIRESNQTIIPQGRVAYENRNNIVINIDIHRTKHQDPCSAIVTTTVWRKSCQIVRHALSSNVYPLSILTIEMKNCKKTRFLYRKRLWKIIILRNNSIIQTRRQTKTHYILWQQSINSVKIFLWRHPIVLPLDYF